MRATLLGLFLLAPPLQQDTGKRITDILTRHLINADHVGISVYSVKSKSIVYELNARKGLIPASNMKVATTAAAIDVLGADFTFATKLYADGEIEQGELRGDLVVMASGDPNISGRDHDGDPTFLFRIWADKLIARKVSVVTGDLRLVNTIFDTEYTHPDWRGQDMTAWFTAPVGAFSLNDNCIDVTVTGGKPPSVQFVPKTRYVTLKNQIVAGTDNAVGFTRKGSEIVIKGEFPAKGTFNGNCTIDNPHQFFGTVLLETLRSKGVEVRGKLVEVNEKVALAPKGEPLDTFSSSLRRTLEICNGHSQNFYAECLLKQLGYRATGTGSFASGSEAVAAYLKKLDIDGAVVHDGSGLSKENRITSDGLVKVLIAMKDRKEFVDSLPAAAESGTLAKRMTKLEGKLRGKTGHVNGVNTLSGYLIAASGDTLIFSILVNDPSVKNAVVDELCELLHGTF